MAIVENSVVRPDLRDPNIYLPGVTFPEKVATSQDLTTAEEPQTFPGPEINGRATEVTLLSTDQLAKSAFLPSLHHIINDAFGNGDGRKGIWERKNDRLKSDNQIIDELGSVPGTFTYVLSFAGTNQAVGTASGKRYEGRQLIVEKCDKAAREKNTWKRTGLVPDDTDAWELALMAVDLNAQRQGVARYLMELVEKELKRRFQAAAVDANGEKKPQVLKTMLTCMKEINYGFYTRRGFAPDYEIFYEPGHLGSTNGFTVIHMSKTVNLEDVPT
ncbi:hypothetical protein BDY17DRAFT_301278 [Neohortaea acidophila]|uniref:N-acetyltransferase domain-containing protein n=1 Tax=Neohortaea acidophila TaxID=245834 RepID=A0A6A6PMW4_9PEZI|nr:uncharacterized protein BDY17DRAFT_301278 [Neohortaea acidophila]KAF2481399.1 hypothetical protein BDY17DRAFT_301278 [Neohortaea acidophila]